MPPRSIYGPTRLRRVTRYRAAGIKGISLSGGLAANDQELRNCALVMVSQKFFARLKGIAESEIFQTLIPLGPTSIRKSNHLENMSKIIAFSFREYRPGTDIEEYVTNAVIDIAEQPTEHNDIFDAVQEAMELLREACGPNALRPYRDGAFSGRIGRTSIEIILVGVIRSLENIRQKANPEEFVRQQIIEFWSSDESRKYSAAGVAGTDRVQYTIPRGAELFSA